MVGPGTAPKDSTQQWDVFPEQLDTEEAVTGCHGAFVIIKLTKNK